MTLYEKYKQLKVSFAVIGLEKINSKYEYFCTPKSAKIFGGAGVDGIHYCFIKAFDEMVFAVSPMNTPGDYVHPVARNFEDFLRLLLACGDAAIIEQTHAWNQEQFDAFLKDNIPAEEQEHALDIIKEKFSLVPMEQPFAYIKELQESFDYSKLKYKSDYYEQVAEEQKEQEAPKEKEPPEWKVYYNCNFSGYHGHERSGKEISVVKQFSWSDEVWYIPAIYACSSGLVVDFCVQVKPDRIKEFINKCDLSHEDDSSFTDEEREQIKVDNPLNIDFRSQIVLNGKTLHQKHSCSMPWIPDSCLPQRTESDLESKWVLEHYGLDPSIGWIFLRIAFPWATKTKPAIKFLRLKLEQEPVYISRIHFNTLDSSKIFPFTHPITGAEHTLTVLDYEKKEMDRQHFRGENQEFPTHYTMMTYVISPELPDSAFLIHDCEKGDRPRQKVNNTMMPQTSGAVAIGIIGGADGPTAIFLSKGSKVKPHVACSALRYEPVNEVKWRLEFREKMRDDIEVELIKNEKAER